MSKPKNWKEINKKLKEFKEYIIVFETNGFEVDKKETTQKVIAFRYLKNPQIDEVFYLEIQNAPYLAIHTKYENQLKEINYFRDLIFVGQISSNFKSFAKDDKTKLEFQARKNNYNRNLKFSDERLKRHHNKNVIYLLETIQLGKNSGIALNILIKDIDELKIIIENILNALDPSHYQIYQEKLEQKQLSNLDRISELEFKENNPDLKDEIGDYQKEDVKVSRIGQGKFRTLLLEKWGGCAVTGCDCNAVLIASHIKSWSDCMKDGLDNKSESKGRFRDAIDPDNGLLLTANLDKLFDQYLISFIDNGKILISKALECYDEEQLQKIFGVKGDVRTLELRIALTDEQKKFLAYHREQFFKEEEKR